MLTAIRVVTIQNYSIIINYNPYALGYFNFQDPEYFLFHSYLLAVPPQVVTYMKSPPGTLAGIHHQLPKPTLKGLGIFNWKNHQIQQRNSATVVLFLYLKNLQL